MKISTQLRLSTGSLAVGIALAATPAFAQDEDVATEEAAAPSNAIIVTGSRIADPTIETTAPVQVIGEELIDASGDVNIQSVLLRNPVFGSPTLSRNNTSFSTSASGIATVDLRNLGTARTLVLVNGRRHVAGVDGSSAVDLNMIPTQLIERSEILTSGSGSAVYGSDAVAGVVNFILKDDFEGLEIGVQQGISEVGDDKTTLITGVIGGNFADGRGNVTMYASYSNEGEAFLRDHKTESGPSEQDSISGIFFGQPFTNSVEPFFSSGPPQGRWTTDNYTWTYGQNGLGALRPCFSANGGACDLEDTPLEGSALDGTTIGPDGFNRTAFRYLAIPTERFNFSGRANYEIAPAANVFLEASFGSVTANSNIEPFFFDSSDANVGGGLAIETLDPNTGNVVRNPFVPDGIYDDAVDTNGDGLRDVAMVKRLVDFGPRQSRATRETFRIVTGVEGDIAPGVDYEVFVNYGKTTIAQNGSGQINVLNFRESQKIISDGQGGYICADEAARGDGCVPANWFGLGSLTPEMIAYLEAPQSFNARISQIQTGGNIGAELFEIAEGAPVRALVGAEYRKEKSSNEWDALQQQGLNGGNALPPTRGEFDVREVYGEIIVPLIDGGMVDHLGISAAARYSDYSTIGTTFSWNAGINFSPIPDIRLRAMYAETVRAPNIGELFDGLNQTFPTLNDPCEGVTLTSTGTTSDQCRAATGVIDNINANGGVFTVSQPDRQGVSGFTGGNPLLEEETGKTLTIGAVINPVSLGLSNLSLKVDYFKVEIEDAIVFTPRQFIVDQCYNEGVQSFCDNFIVRRPNAVGLNNAGSLQFVNSGPSNSGGEEIEGIDVVLNYGTELGFLSTPVDMNFSIAYTHLFDHFTIPLPGSDKDNRDGEVGNAKNRFTTFFTLGTDTVKLNLIGTYIGESFLDDQFTGEIEGSNNDYRVHPEFYLDTQLQWFINDTMEFYVGVDNVFDNDPVYFASTPDATTAMESNNGVYDPIGRRYYAGARFRF